MYGIVIRFPDWMVRHLLDWAEGHQRIREGYAIGTGRWRALPFALNVLTHSRQRYRRCASMPMSLACALAAPPHWVREGYMQEQVLAGVGDDDTPTLLIQAEEERVVDNRMHDRFVNCALPPVTLVKG